jgi:uncharacterized phage protein gp47/JayE
MAIVPKTVEEIIDDITTALVDQYAISSDVGQGTVLGALVRSFAAPLASLWADLTVVERDSNLATAEGESLDLLVNTFGMSRVTGAYSEGSVVARPKAPSNVGNVVAGSYFVYGDLVLEVLESVALMAPYSIIPVRSGTPGSAFNLPANTPLLSTNDTLNAQFTFAVGSGLNGQGTPTGGMSGGTDTELDTELRQRFANFLQSLTRATYQAVLQALQSIPELTSVSLLDVTPMPGFISVYIDDGSSSTVVSDEIKAIIESTLLDWRAAGIGVRIYMLDKVVDPVVLNITVDPTSVPADVQQAARQSIIALLAGYAQGQPLYLSKLVDTAFNVAGVLDVKVLSPAADIIVGTHQAYRPSSVTVNVSV